MGTTFAWTLILSGLLPAGLDTVALLGEQGRCQASKGKIDVIQLLIESGAKLNSKDKTGYTMHPHIAILINKNIKFRAVICRRAANAARDSL
eukprot:1194531-Prorocentrum_minimum.AAC.6